MLLKLVGSIFVIFAGSYLGFSIAKRYIKRPNNLRQVLSCIVSLKSYINYTVMPLSDSLMNCALGANQEVTNFFITTANLLKNNYLLLPQEAIQQSLILHKNKLSLTKEDCEVLLLFGCHLGEMNREEQQKYLTMIQKRLEILEGEATALRDKNSKMYRYLGVCGSLMVVLLLF